MILLQLRTLLQRRHVGEDVGSKVSHAHSKFDPSHFALHVDKMVSASAVLVSYFL